MGAYELFCRLIADPDFGEGYSDGISESRHEDNLVRIPAVIAPTFDVDSVRTSDQIYVRAHARQARAAKVRLGVHDDITMTTHGVTQGPGHLLPVGSSHDALRWIPPIQRYTVVGTEQSSLRPIHSFE